MFAVCASKSGVGAKRVDLCTDIEALSRTRRQAPEAPEAPEAGPGPRGPKRNGRRSSEPCRISGKTEPKRTPHRSLHGSCHCFARPRAKFLRLIHAVGVHTARIPRSRNERASVSPAGAFAPSKIGSRLGSSPSKTSESSFANRARVQETAGVECPQKLRDPPSRNRCARRGASATVSSGRSVSSGEEHPLRATCRPAGDD